MVMDVSDLKLITPTYDNIYFESCVVLGTDGKVAYYTRDKENPDVWLEFDFINGTYKILDDEQE